MGHRFAALGDSVCLKSDANVSAMSASRPPEEAECAGMLTEVGEDAGGSPRGPNTTEAPTKESAMTTGAKQLGGKGKEMPGALEVSENTSAAKTKPAIAEVGSLKNRSFF